MEFIIWLTGGSTTPGSGLKEPFTRNGMFRLNDFDREILNIEMVELSKETTADMIKNGDISDSDMTHIYVEAEDDITFKEKCINTFTKLLDINTKNIVDNA